MPGEEIIYYPPGGSASTGSAPAGSVAGKFDRTAFTAASIVSSCVDWHDLSAAIATATAPRDLTLTGISTGQVIHVGFGAFWGNEAANAYIDVGSLVGGNIISTWGQNGAEGATNGGVMHWCGISGAAVLNPFQGGTVGRAIAGSTELNGTTLTLRFRWRTSAAAAKTLVATTDFPVHLWAWSQG